MGGRFYKRDLGIFEKIMVTIVWLTVIVVFFRACFEQPKQNKKTPNNFPEFTSTSNLQKNESPVNSKIENYNKNEAENLESKPKELNRDDNLTKEKPKEKELPKAIIDKIANFDEVPSDGITLIPKELLIQYLKDHGDFDYVKEYTENDLLAYTKHIFVKKVDLNSDSKPDYLIVNYNKDYCGSAGCLFEIYAKNTLGFVSILDIPDSVLINPSDEEIEIIDSTSNGYKDININEVNYEKSVLKFNGLKYKRYKR